MISITLPFPPSCNRLWRHYGKRVLLSREARSYYARVAVVIRPQHLSALTERLLVMIDVFPPDRRRRDLDNISKATLDACTKARVWTDDALIDELYIRRREPIRGQGKVEITINEIKPN